MDAPPQPSVPQGSLTIQGFRGLAAATAAKSLQLCPTLSDPMDCSPPGSSVHGIFQARVLEWGAIREAFILLIMYLLYIVL